jgi:polysaccharide export outer membrane protein
MQYLSTVRLALVAGFVMLAGCSFPGANMSVNNNDETSVDISEEVEVRSISPALIQEINQSLRSPKATPNPELDQAIVDYNYRIGVADVLNVTIWDHPELTIPAGSFRSAADSGNWVHADGTIFYPYIGRVEVAGKTVSEVRDLIANKLSQFIESPQVDVSISAFRSQRVYVSGEVMAGGAEAITNVPLTLVDAINNAGGITEFADWQRVWVSRGDLDHQVDLRALMQYGDLSQNLLLQHGDIVHVPRNDTAQVFVMGAVNKTSAVPTGRNPMSLTEALAQSEGMNDAVADASGVFVIRVDDSSDKLATVYQLNLENATALALANRFYLEPNDVVYVATEPVAVWNRLITQLMPTAQAVYYSSATYNDLAN